MCHLSTRYFVNGLTWGFASGATFGAIVMYIILTAEKML